MLSSDLLEQRLDFMGKRIEELLNSQPLLMDISGIRIVDSSIWYVDVITFSGFIRALSLPLEECRFIHLVTNREV